MKFLAYILIRRKLRKFICLSTDTWPDGIVAYAYMTFELTAMAVLEGWSAEIILIDIVWGVALTTLVSVVGRIVFDKQANR